MIQIERLGREGDGIGDGRHVPFTLPGERVRLGDPPQILTPAPFRVAAPCPYFGTCGGCSVQHASDAFLAAWKQGLVERALGARGLKAAFRPVVTSPPQTRRRAVFSVRRTKKTVQIGFHARASDRLVDIESCQVILPGMLNLRPAMAALARAGGSRKGTLRMQVTGTLGGWDLDVSGGKPLDGPLRSALAGIADAHDLARLTWEGEVVVRRRPPVVRFGRAEVELPPRAFLQATSEGEAALVAAVREATGPAARIGDLFAGCGTFALPLAETAEVVAIDASADMIAALDAGWRGTDGLKAVRTEARDLFRRPLEPGELARFDAVVIDPPRAGAEAQSRRIAASAVPVVAAVSCDPASFARDAEILLAGGFTLDWVQVIDQFRWSGHVELAARFSRIGGPQGR